MVPGLGEKVAWLLRPFRYRQLELGTQGLGDSSPEGLLLDRQGVWRTLGEERRRLVREKRMEKRTPCRGSRTLPDVVGVRLKVDRGSHLDVVAGSVEVKGDRARRLG